MNGFFVLNIFFNIFADASAHQKAPTERVEEADGWSTTY